MSLKVIFRTWREIIEDKHFMEMRKEEAAEEEHRQKYGNYGGVITKLKCCGKTQRGRNCHFPVDKGLYCVYHK